MTPGCWAERLRLGLGLRPLRHHGAGAYICGEETALLKPRGQEGDAAHEAAFPGGGGALWLPDDGEQRRVDRCGADDPAAGASWFSSFGRPNKCGHQDLRDLGPCERPCVVEESMSIPFVELIDKHCGGIRGGWDNLKAVIPGARRCRTSGPRP
jgi:NADH-quinone oxidoreductase subunit F